ncbi:hypothetical protein SDC9_156434 [bioreactor metagenome]|uniref:DUF2680 domain-containing protein n=1 Tax=bioreactor metagenome TaxID=1076179 RepID=A0A645F690_9ZZZZ
MGKVKLPKLISALLILAVVFTLGISAFAAESTEDTTNDSDTTVTQRVHEKSRPELTDEQKAEMKAKMEEQKAKMEASKEAYDALTDEQLAEISALVEQRKEISKQIIEKYEEFGVVDSDTADDMITELEKDNDKAGMSFMGGNRGPRGPGMHKGPSPDDTTADTTEESVS